MTSTVAAVSEVALAPEMALASNAALAQVVDAIARNGIAVVPAFVAAATTAGLRARALAQDAAGLLHEAGVGRTATRDRASHVRGDRIAWLADSPDSPDAPIDAIARDLFERLRIVLNHELMLGLVDVEAHYAIYPPGAGYIRHRDRFRDDDSRIISCVLYLNDSWQSSEGGSLRFHFDGQPSRDVAPEGGTLVAFLAEPFEHEVLPATRQRVSLAGWLRRRPLQRRAEAT